MPELNVHYLISPLGIHIYAGTDADTLIERINPVIFRRYTAHVPDTPEQFIGRLEFCIVEDSGNFPETIHVNKEGALMFYKREAPEHSIAAELDPYIQLAFQELKLARTSDVL